LDLFVKKLAEKKIIFYDDQYYSSAQIIGNSKAAQKVNALKNLGIKFKIVFLLPEYRSPAWEYFETEKSGLIVGSGQADILTEDTIVNCTENRPDFRLSANLGWPFSTIDLWLNGTEIEAAENKSDFMPAEFFEMKKKMYFTYAPNIDTYKINVPEILYVAGPPSIGKTNLSKYIAHKWKYIYLNTAPVDVDPLKSYVVDVNPKSRADFPSASRIFLIAETDLNIEATRLLISHLLLARKKFFLRRGKAIKYDLDEMEEYFKISDANRFPAVKLVKIDYIPYQYYNMKRYGADMDLFYKFLM
jgi:hypothetical protein